MPSCSRFDEVVSIIRPTVVLVDDAVGLLSRIGA